VALALNALTTGRLAVLFEAAGCGYTRPTSRQAALHITLFLRMWFVRVSEALRCHSLSLLVTACFH
jgi:hypothetical protein